jgi:hypothetical protein
MRICCNYLFLQKKDSDPIPAAETLPAAEATSTLSISNASDSTVYTVTTSVSGKTLSSLSSYGDSSFTISLPNARNGASGDNLIDL